MPDSLRAAVARLAASKYAPKPDGSSLTYGFISLSMLALLLTVFSTFYTIDLLVYPAALSVAGAAAFAAGVLIRKRGKRRHNAAFAVEYARQSPKAKPKADSR